ncbi:MAG: (d)CMP kinase [Bacteroidia bacterium]|nr:(d)CMP kinase [Bacteroidia bacterium]
MNKIIIAIDGYSACGKSTTAKNVAKALHYVHVDTGAMYRGVALYLLRKGIPVDRETPELFAALDEIHLEFDLNPDGASSDLILNGENVEQEIRTLTVSNVVSEVAAMKPVREKLVLLQHQIGKKKGIVMDGRDIGTVVFPHADLKIFMSATLEKRVERRQLQLSRSGISQSDKEIRDNIRHRDHIDTTRQESPLRRAADALELDTTDKTIDQQVQFVVEHAMRIINENVVTNA